MDKRKIYGKMVCANWGIRTALVPIQLCVENLNNTRQSLTSKALGQPRSCAWRTAEAAHSWERGPTNSMEALLHSCLQIFTH